MENREITREEDLGFDRMLVSEVSGREVVEMFDEARRRSTKIGCTGPGLTDLWVDQVGDWEPAPTPESLCQEELEARRQSMEEHRLEPWYHTTVIHLIARGMKQIEADTAHEKDLSALKKVVDELTAIIEVGCGHGTDVYSFLQNMKARHRKNLGQEE